MVQCFNFATLEIQFVEIVETYIKFDIYVSSKIYKLLFVEFHRFLCNAEWPSAS